MKPIAAILVFTLSLFAFSQRIEAGPQEVFDAFIGDLDGENWLDAYNRIEPESRSWMVVLLGITADKQKQLFPLFGKKELGEKIVKVFENQKDDVNEVRFFSDLMTVYSAHSGDFTMSIPLRLLQFEDDDKGAVSFELRDLKLDDESASANVVATNRHTEKKVTTPVEFVKLENKWLIRLVFSEDDRPKQTIAPFEHEAEDDSAESPKRALLQPDRPAGWPKFSENLEGTNPVRVSNPNKFDVVVGVRAGSGGEDFEVAAGKSGRVHVPPGKYEVYFIYSSNPERILKGDDFEVETGKGIEIRMVQSVTGNFGIRPVK